MTFDHGKRLIIWIVLCTGKILVLLTTLTQMQWQLLASSGGECRLLSSSYPFRSKFITYNLMYFSRTYDKFLINSHNFVWKWRLRQIDSEKIVTLPKVHGALQDNFSENKFADRWQKFLEKRKQNRTFHKSFTKSDQLLDPSKGEPFITLVRRAEIESAIFLSRLVLASSSFRVLAIIATVRSFSYLSLTALHLWYYHFLLKIWQKIVENH